LVDARPINALAFGLGAPPSTATVPIAGIAAGRVLLIEIKNGKVYIITLFSS
jgi:hypothetical protein